MVLSLSVMLSGGTSAFAKQADGPEYTLKDYLNDNGINLEKGDVVEIRASTSFEKSKGQQIRIIKKGNDSTENITLIPLGFDSNGNLVNTSIIDTTNISRAATDPTNANSIIMSDNFGPLPINLNGIAITVNVTTLYAEYGAGYISPSGVRSSWTSTNSYNVSTLTTQWIVNAYIYGPSNDWESPLYPYPGYYQVTLVKDNPVKNVTYEKLLANQYPGNYFNLNTGLGGQSLNVTVTVNGSTFGNEIQY